MSGRIVVFGATGYTGRNTAEALVKRGAKPVLAARTREKVEALAAELGGLESAVADVGDPASVRALVEAGDVLLSTVGPFIRWGHPAAEAAVDAGAHYVDSTGEPAFIRRVFEIYGPRAAAKGVGMLTALGYDYVPGNFAGALAIEQAGDGVARVDVAYSTTGKPSRPIEGSRLAKMAGGMGGASGGTLSSAIGVFAEPSFSFRDGAIVTERGAKRVGTVAGLQGISVGGSEHFALPRLAPGLREVNCYLGWFGPFSRVVQTMGVVNAGVMAAPGGKRLLAKMAERVPGSTGGPSEGARAETGSKIAATAYDASGAELAVVQLTGVNGYTFTFEMLAWGALRAAAGGLQGVGALGPADGFGLEGLREGVESAGLSVRG
jgi:short subunit dehydrogenase-like uncharacterized protein